MATHSSILAWRIPWTEELGRLQSMGSQRVNTTEQLKHTHGKDKLFAFMELLFSRGMAQMVNNLPAMLQTMIQFLGWDDRLEKEMATHSSILAWRIPWTGEPGSLQSMGRKESDTTD